VLRKVLSPLVLVCALFLPASGASAAGESLSVTPRLDPIAGVPSGIDYAYNTGGLPLLLKIVTRPTSSPPCQPTRDEDVAVAGTAGTQEVTPTEIPLNGNGLGDVAFTWPSAGTWRICAWLYGQPAETIAADLGKQNSVRAAISTLTIDVKQINGKAGGADVLLHAVGATELPGTLFGLALPDRQGGCPATYHMDSGEALFAPVAGRSIASGAFDANLQTSSLLALRRWRICAYLQDGDAADTALAVGSQFIDLTLKPTLVRKPKVTVKNGKATCATQVAGRPTPKLSVTWLLGSKNVGKGKRIGVRPAWKGKKLSCQVTAKNSLGKKSAKSKATRV
jgi:hypothetical protein